jgi:hypothetical protein
MSPTITNIPSNNPTNNFMLRPVREGDGEPTMGLAPLPVGSDGGSGFDSSGSDGGSGFDGSGSDSSGSDGSGNGSGSGSSGSGNSNDSGNDDSGNDGSDSSGSDGSGSGIVAGASPSKRAPHFPQNLALSETSFPQF